MLSAPLIETGCTLALGTKDLPPQARGHHPISHIRRAASSV
jgi:hypothetical protein